MKDNDAIIAKIQKLLSLANSDNEHEAKVATARANELLIKHNLELQQVVDAELEYGSETVETTGLTLKPHQKMIAQILMEFFFVKVMIGRKHVGFSSGRWASRNATRAQYQKTIQLVGTKANTKIAGYIFQYLNQSMPHLWEQYKKLNEITGTSRKTSYYLGLQKGIMMMLRETKWKVENETGLVVIKDPKLEEHVKNMSNGTYGDSKEPEIDPATFKAGLEDGKKVSLRKPIESERSEGPVLRLGSKN